MEKPDVKDLEKKPKAIANAPKTLTDWLSPEKAKSTVSNQEESKASYFKTAMTEVFRADNLDVRSRVREDMILPLSVGRTVARRFGNSPLINGFIDDVERISISLNGGSRREMTDIAKGLQPVDNPDMNAQSMLSRKLLGNR